MRTKLNLTLATAAFALLFAPLAAGQGAVQSVGSARPTDVTSPAPSGLIIGPGDVIKVDVIGPEAVRSIFTKDCLVGIDGYFEYPRIGRVKAVGRTLEDIKQEITRGLSDQLVNPQVTVGILQQLNKRISVGGEVKTVGQIPYAGAIGVLEVIIRANGVTDQAGEEALILRPGSPNIKVDLASLLAGDTRKDVLLQDGDTLMVQKALPVFVQGAITNPGPYVVRRGTTVQQLLTIAGGITEKGKTSGIKIQRPGADPKKKPNEFPNEFPVKDYKTEIVKPGDIVIVPNRKI